MGGNVGGNVGGDVGGDVRGNVGGNVGERRHWVLYIQRNLSIVDTIRTQLAVLCREMSLIQRWICTQLYVVGTADSVLIREVILYSEDPLWLWRFPSMYLVIAGIVRLTLCVCVGTFILCQSHVCLYQRRVIEVFRAPLANCTLLSFA